MRQDRRNYFEALVERAELAEAEKSLKKLNYTTKKPAGKSWATNSTVKDKTGKILSNQKEQCKKWKEYSDLILPVQDIYKYDTRFASNDNLYMPASRTNYGLSGFKVVASRT